MEADSENKGLARSCAESLLSSGKQRAIPRPWRATVSAYSNLQGSLVTRTKSAVKTIKFYSVLLGLKSAVLLIPTLKLEGYKFKYGNSWLPRCNLWPETGFSLIRCIGKIATEVYCYIITRRNNSYAYHQKKKKIFIIVDILKAGKFYTEERLLCSQNKLLYLKRLTATGVLCSTTTSSF